MHLQAQELRRAMAASLAESEAERQRQEQMEQQIGLAASLERRFSSSPLLAALKALVPTAKLVDSPAGVPLERLLKLEKQVRCLCKLKPMG